MPKLPISWWASIIKEGIEAGLSGASILKRARESGASIRTQTFYEILNEVRSSMEFEDLIKNVPPTKPLSDRQIPKTPVNLPTKYQFVVEVEWEGETGKFGIYTDKPMSQEEIKEEAKWLAWKEYGIEVENVRLIRARRKA